MSLELNEFSNEVLIKKYEEVSVKKSQIEDEFQDLEDKICERALKYAKLYIESLSYLNSLSCCHLKFFVPNKDFITTKDLKIIDSEIFIGSCDDNWEFSPC